MRLKIEKLVYGGAGLARTEQGVIFVPRSAAGDLVEAEVVNKKKDYATARIVQLLEPSTDRQEPYCPNYHTAGCCHWQHIRYDRQVQYKENIIRETLQRGAHLRWDGNIKLITGSDRHYRMRAVFHVTDGRLGFVQENTHKVVPITSCSALVGELNDFIGTVDASGVREVYALSAPEVVTSFVLNDGTIKRLGRAEIQVEGAHYGVTADTFFQPNRSLLSSIIRELVDQVGTANRVLELYAGAGFFSIPLARIATEVIGIESNRAAVRQARENATNNKAPHLRFFEGDVNTLMRGSDLKPDVVVLDPPRAGASVETTEQIAALQSQKIVYVSCNPTTFAREAAVLTKRGYRLSRITLIDQFPNTYHIETVATLELNLPGNA